MRAQQIQEKNTDKIYYPFINTIKMHNIKKRTGTAK